MRETFQSSQKDTYVNKRLCIITVITTVKVGTAVAAAVSDFLKWLAPAKYGTTICDGGNQFNAPLF